ncbi:MAG: hypothetical protein KZQ99_22230 [Candidatus Thiodiazotropha sp. (ex Dulcina madagascariensis)]|nr:hypothetical protein [Candidatus Thiodiazotropha sp. (ex Dulcina madagascariensis)]
MGIAAPRILIVDDKQEHGEAVARKLWKLGYASLFVKYDQQDLMDGVYGPYYGVRLVIMDLDLAGEGRIGDGSRAYSDVTATLQALLGENNGPWILVTWTGHADHAEALFMYLKKRLSDCLHPVSNAVMDKEDFINSDGTEKDDGDIGSRLQELVRQERAIGCLLGWEAAVCKSANQVTYELSHTAKKLDGDIQQNLGHLLFELTKAEAGETVDDLSDYAPELYSLLASLLSDILTVFVPDADNPCSEPTVSAVAGGIDITGWKRAINGMINFENRYCGGAFPGALFKVTDE